MAKEKEYKKQKEAKLLQNLYKDFKGTLGEALGDAGETFKKHKVLVIIAFLVFLLYRNKQLSISNFVKKIENAIKGKEYDGGEDF